MPGLCYGSKKEKEVKILVCLVLLLAIVNLIGHLYDRIYDWNHNGIRDKIMNFPYHRILFCSATILLLLSLITWRVPMRVAEVMMLMAIYARMGK